MKLLIDTYQIKKDQSSKDYFYSKCPNCNEQLLIGKKGLIDNIKDVPWWLWVVIIATIAIIDFESFKWIFIEPAYRILLLASGMWVIGFFVAFFIYLLGEISKLFRKNQN